MRKYSLEIFAMHILNIIPGVLVIASGSAFALGFTNEVGKSYVNLDIEIGKSSSGLYLQSNWIKNVNDGIQVSGVGIGYNVELGPVMLNAGVKALYIGPQKGDNGVAFPVGTGVEFNFIDSLFLYGEAYSATEQMNNSVKSYEEANGGISWKPISLLTIKAGYRYVGVDGKNGLPGHTLFDGPYVGAGVTF